MKMLITQLEQKSFMLVFALLIACLCCTQALASDLDIYEDGGVDDVVITIMIDQSGSMAELDTSCNKLDELKKNDARYDKYKAYGFDEFPVYTCKNNSGGDKDKLIIRRFDNVRMAVSDVLDQLDETYTIGLGVYPINDAQGDNANKNGNAGKIIVPARKLTVDQKTEIRNKLKPLYPSNGTPAANAYAEAAAYMLGRTTLETVSAETVFKEAGRAQQRQARRCILFFCSTVNIDVYDVYECTANVTNVSNFDGKKWRACSTEKTISPSSGWSRDQIVLTFPVDTTTTNGRFTTYGIASSDTVAGSANDSAYSGYTLSASSTKAGSSYNSAVVNSASECGGNGIFFLTDGEPNASSTDIATSLMKNATGNNSFTCSGSTLSNAGVRGNVYTNGTNDPNAAAWTCMSNLAVDLDARTNAPGTRIYTATSGYGPIFSSIGSAINNKLSQFSPNARIPTLIEEGKLTLDDCDVAGASPDAKNLCKLGILGKGGFSFGQESSDVSAAIKRFAEGTSGPEEKISTGTMSVPVDSLNIVQSQNEIYLPVLGINRDIPIGLWPGNLKKYKIEDGTIVARTGSGTVSTTTLFESRDGDFKTSVWDFWNTDSATQPDNADPTTGGSRSKILENTIPAVEDGDETPPNRYAWINSGGALSRIDVIGTTPSGFGTPLSDLTNERKINLLNFLGYPVPTNFNGDDEINDGTELNVGGEAITQSAQSKVLGAVLHSTPQLITYSANISTDGQITDREDFILYGSMDGALHLVNDDTGKEVFNFIPKEVLKRQGQAFMPGGTFTQSEGIPYGVDGPWTVYSVLSNGLSNIEAKQVLTFGGLRMGGSNYYGLDLTSYRSPRLVYNVGSTYSDNVDSTGTLLSDISASTTSNGGSGPNFSRMGQTWGKPSVGFVTIDGRRTMVNFLPGGYDVCYEDPEFKLNSDGPGGSLVGTTCDNKSRAQGSAVYMVGVGTSEVDAQTDNVKKINLNSTKKGSLLWSTDEGLLHSVVSEIRVLDRNNDGLSDHLYFSDLGGSVYRVDINNDKNTDFSASDPVKVLDASGAATGSDAPPRFYERPLVTFVRLDDSRQVVATVTVGSGDRSSPLYDDREVANRLYTVIDKDIARADMFVYDNPATTTDEASILDRSELLSQNLKPVDFGGNTGATKLLELKFNLEDATKVRADINANEAQGWFYKLDMFEGVTEVTGLKVFNEPDALNRRLNINVFNPESIKGTSNCAGGVRGSSMRQLMCLPYGACPGRETSTPYISSGKGIVDSFVVSLNETDDDRTTIGILDTKCEGDECNRCLGDECTTVCEGSTCGTGNTGGDPGFKEKLLGERDLRPLDWLQRR